MRRLTAACLAAASFVLGACSNDAVFDNEARVRFQTAMPDAPVVEYILDEGIQLNADYGQGSRFLSVTQRSYRVTIRAILPFGERQDLLQVDQQLNAGEDYTFVAVGALADGDPELLLFINPLQRVTPDFFRLQVLHAVPGALAVDVYLTAPEDDLAGAVALGTLGFRDVIDRQEFPVGPRRLRLTPVGQPGTLLFDSGEFNLRSGGDFFFTILANTDTGPSSLAVAVNDGSATVALRNTGSVAELRVAHLSPDGPPIDVVATDATEATTALADDLPYGSVTAYNALAPGSYLVSATPAADPATPLVEFSQTLTAGQRGTIAYVGLLANISNQVLTDNNRPVFTEGRLALYHASVAAGAVDVYLEAPGTNINSEDPTFVNVIGGAFTGRFGVPPGDYTLTLTRTGTKDVLVTTDPPLPLQGGRVLTVIARDAPRPDGNADGLPVGLIVLDDAP